MVREALTAAEILKHEMALSRIRERLFRTHAPEAYFIVPGSENVIRAHAESRWNAACGDYRVLYLGGLTYTIDCADRRGLGEMGVRHMQDDQFSFWICGPRGHTVHSSTIRFEVLDTRAHELVQSYHISLKPIHRAPGRETGKT